MFVSLIAHELGHATLANGYGSVGGYALNPEQAAWNGSINEGAALIAEYVISKQLGYVMYSGELLASQLDNVMLGLGIDLNTVGLQSVNSLAAAGSAAMNTASTWVLDNLRPSVAPQLTYREYYANHWVISNCGNSGNILNGGGINNFSPDKIDWARMPAGNLDYQLNPSTGTCTFSLANIPLKDGSVISLTGATGRNPAAPIASMTMTIDRNHDGIWDGMQVGLDLNRNGGIDRFINTGDSQKSMLDADRELSALFRNGALGTGFWNLYTDWSTSQLINNDYTTILDHVTPDLSPIGAFYESKSAAFDAAGTIADKTMRILDSAGGALSASQLAALDADRDGKLAGAELDGLMAWRDLDEDGILDIHGRAELVSLGAALDEAGTRSIRSGDYAFYTAGNAAFRHAGQGAAAAPSNTLAAPHSPAAA